MRKFINKILCGDTLEVLKTLPDECIDCIVTSPPYYGLRDYGVDGQVGLESSFEEYIEKMLAITAELKRVLKQTGTLWWNHGDSYGTGSGSGTRKGKQATNRGTQKFERWQKEGKPVVPGYEKCLLLQPYRLAQRMIDEQGWVLRNILIWHKPNCMPSSVKDRFTVDYEPILFFTKSKKYWFEMQYESWTDQRLEDLKRAGKFIRYSGKHKDSSENKGVVVGNPILGRNKRSVWKIPTQPYSEAHFAVFPQAICEIPIKSGCPEMICKKCGVVREKVFEAGELVSSCEGQPLAKKPRSNPANKLKKAELEKDEWGALPRRERKEIGLTDCNCNADFEGGIVLDPFMGSGTTAVVARRLGRRYVGIELNSEYIKLAEERLRKAEIKKCSYPCNRQTIKGGILNGKN